MVTGGRTALECVCIIGQSFAEGKGGGGCLSVSWACVVLAAVYTAYCVCSSKNNGVKAPETAA